ncbi:MAG: hypothetical protein ACJAVA_000360 [Flavobacteriaceae bacterium]|jgi:hypothetical protein
MNYKILAKNSLEKLFVNTELKTVGEIFRAIIRESTTGIKIENKSRFTELSDEDWYLILEKTIKNEESEDK